MIENVYKCFFALRRTDTSTGDVAYLQARVQGVGNISERFYEKESWQSVTWRVRDTPTWFKTAGDACRRLNTRSVKAARMESHQRWDVIEVQLVARTTVLRTTETDVIAKLALITEGAA